MVEQLETLTQKELASRLILNTQPSNLNFEKFPLDKSKITICDVKEKKQKREKERERERERERGEQKEC